jgi:hypothetical protein
MAPTPRRMRYGRVVTLSADDASTDHVGVMIDEPTGSIASQSSHQSAHMDWESQSHGSDTSDPGDSTAANDALAPADLPAAPSPTPSDAEFDELYAEVLANPDRTVDDHDSFGAAVLAVQASGDAQAAADLTQVLVHLADCEVRLEPRQRDGSHFRSYWIEPLDGRDLHVRRPLLNLTLYDQLYRGLQVLHDARALGMIPVMRLEDADPFIDGYLQCAAEEMAFVSRNEAWLRRKPSSDQAYKALLNYRRRRLHVLVMALYRRRLWRTRCATAPLGMLGLCRAVRYYDCHSGPVDPIYWRVFYGPLHGASRRPSYCECGADRCDDLRECSRCGRRGLFFEALLSECADVGTAADRLARAHARYNVVSKYRRQRWQLGSSSLHILRAVSHGYGSCAAGGAILASHRLKNFLPDLQQAWDLFAPVFSHLPRPPSSWGSYLHLPIGDWYSARVTENFILADVAPEAKPPLTYPVTYEGPWRRADR